MASIASDVAMCLGFDSGMGFGCQCGLSSLFGTLFGSELLCRILWMGQGKATNFTQTPKKNKNEFWNCHLAMLGRVDKPNFTSLCPGQPLRG